MLERTTSSRALDEETVPTCIKLHCHGVTERRTELGHRMIHKSPLLIRKHPVHILRDVSLHLDVDKIGRWIQVNVLNVKNSPVTAS